MLEAKKQEPSYTPFKIDYAYKKYVHSHNVLNDRFSHLDFDEKGLTGMNHIRSGSVFFGKQNNGGHSKKKLIKKSLELQAGDHPITLVQEINILNKSKAALDLFGTGYDTTRSKNANLILPPVVIFKKSVILLNNTIEEQSAF